MALEPHPLLDDLGRGIVDDIGGLEWPSADSALSQRDREGTFSWDDWRRCSKLGLCGLPAPVSLGGQGATRVATAGALEALGYECADRGLVFSLNAHLWSAVIPLWQFGSSVQQERYLARLCSGEWIGLHAITEPDSGSDAFALATTARRDDGGYTLSGRKALITNAPVARVFLVFARSPGTEGPLGVTAFIVDADTEGVQVGAPASKVGLRTSPLSEIHFDDVRLNADAVVGRAGRGALILAKSMEWERLLIMAAQLGALSRSIEAAADLIRDHERGPARTAEAEGIADVRAKASAARALLYETAWRYDRGDAGDGAEAASVKLVAAETVLAGALNLIDLVGQPAGDEALPFARGLRDGIGAPIYSGTSQIMRRIIARSMGL